MDNQYLTQAEIESSFQSLTFSLLNWPDGSMVRIEWPQDGGAFESIEQDVCYLAISPTDNAQTRQFYTEYTEQDSASATSSQTYIDAFRVLWLFYGPSSTDNADLVRASLNLDSTTDSLMASNLALITDIPVPMRQPELFNGQWWPRCSFYANFTQLVKRESTTPYLASADIQIEEG